MLRGKWVRAVSSFVLALGLLVGGAAGAGAAPVTVSASKSAVASASAAVRAAEPRGALGPLTALLIDRLEIADLVAAAKFGTDRPIDDPVREQQLLDQVHARSVGLGLDPDATVRIFRDQIEANKLVQRGLFAYWTSHPSQAPTVRPDLAVLRARLDQLTTDILDQLVRTARVRASGTGCRVQVAVAARTGETLRHLDALHRQALSIAVASLCAGTR